MYAVILSINLYSRGRGAIAQALVVGVPQWRSGFEPELSHVGFVVVVVRFSPSTSVSAENHSTDCSTLIIRYPGLVK
jgi:hypothetical protein